MAKPLVFHYGDRDVPFAMEKIDRSKLYGWIDTVALDDQGRTCELATLLGDGRTIVAKGGRAIGFVSPDGEWLAKSDLKAVDLEGKEIKPVGSSFGAPIPLTNHATIEDYLSHNVKATYLMTPETLAPELIDELKKGVIYSFQYSFRGGLNPDVGFLLANPEGQVFLMVGQPTKIHFVGLEQAASLTEDEAAPEAEEDEDLDFGMM
jgi:hypothetical protein